MEAEQDRLLISGSFQGNFKCTWTIKQFSSLFEKLYQTAIYQDDDKNMNWNLLFYPRRTENCVFCVVVRTAIKEVNCKSYISLRNTCGEILFKSEPDKYNVYVNGEINEIARTERQALESKLTNDVLIVNLEVVYCLTHVQDDHDFERHAKITPMVKVIEDLRGLWTRKKNTDFVISVAGHDIPVHSVIIGARSKVFAAMFKHDTVEKGNRRVEVTDFEKDTMDAFLEFVYSGTVLEMDFDLALELLRASDKYEVSGLKLYCSNYLISFLEDENVSQVLMSADIYNAEELRCHSLEFFCDNVSEEFFEDQRSIFRTRPDLLCDIIRKLISKRKHRNE